MNVFQEIPCVVVVVWLCGVVWCGVGTHMNNAAIGNSDVRDICILLALFL